MKKIVFVLGSLIILTILGQDVFAEEHFCKNDKPVDLEYELDYGKINAICLDEVALAIGVFIETEGEGVFTLTIPRDVFDVRNPDCSDKTFDVLGDYGDPKVLETKITKESRTIEIHFGQDVKKYLIITTDTGIMKPYKLGSECLEEEWEIFWVKGDHYFPNSKKGFQIFKIPYKITGGQVEKIEFEPGGITAKIKTGEAGIFEIQVPRNLPVSNYGSEDGFPVILEDGELVKDYGEIKTPCYGHFSIPFQNGSQTIELFGTSTMSTAQGPIRGIPVPDDCIIKPSPLLQVKNGVNPQDVVCHAGLQLIIKSTDGSPACVKPKTVEKLIERGWAKPSERIEKTENIQKFDTAFYLKIQKLIDDKEIRYYSVVFFVNDANKDKLEKVLIENHNATNVNKLSELSFVIAKVPIPEIPKLADYDFVLQIGDGEQKVTTAPEKQE